MKKINSKMVLATLFMCFLFCTSFISYRKLINFYANGETDYNEWNASTDSKLETDYISNFWLKYQYVNLNGWMCRILGQHEMNGVVELNNGYLNQTNDYLNDDSIMQYAEQTQLFQEHLKERGIEYIFFTVPYVVDKYDPQLPTGIVDYGNDNLDRLTEAFEQQGIKTYDLREALYNEGLETYDIFYRTDHHWTTQGGFWAYNEIVNYMEKEYGFQADDTIGNIDNYTITKYEKWHLGSRGQRTGKYYAGIDDFDLILPNFETYIERWGTEEGGDMQTMMINMAPLEKSDYMSRYTYDWVMGSSCGAWHNPNASVDKTIVIISDSMSKAVCPYLALTFSNVIYYYDADVSGITKEWLDTYQPDIIFSLNYITNTVYDSAYDWNF